MSDQNNKPTAMGTSGMAVETSSAEIRQLIHTIRGEQVMLDSDLARLYGVETKVFNQRSSATPSASPNDSASVSPMRNSPS